MNDNRFWFGFWALVAVVILEWRLGSPEKRDRAVSKFSDPLPRQPRSLKENHHAHA